MAGQASSPWPRGAARPPRRRLPPVLVPAALVLLQAADAAASGAGATGARSVGHGSAAGGLVIGREDLLRVRSSLGRISDELHLILGVLDQHIAETPVPLVPTEGAVAAVGAGAAAAAAAAQLLSEAQAQPGEFVPLPRAAENATQGGYVADSPAREYLRAGASWAWVVAEWLVWFGIFVLDIGIVVGMQLFLESIGRKRGGSSIMPKKGVANAIAAKEGHAPGTPIPAPSATPGRGSTQRLSVLSQEEWLAAQLTEHWFKLAVGAGLAVASRLPQYVLNSEGLTCHMLINLAVMLRCMSLVMLLIRDDMTLPKRERAEMAAAAAAAAPASLSDSSRRRPPGINGDG